MAQQTCFTGGALAVEAADSVDAGGAVETGGAGAVVDVGGTVGSGPAVDADAGEAAGRVGAGGAVVTDARPQRALVDVLFAKLAGVRRRTLTVVAVDEVDASGAVLAQVARTVVNIFFAVLTAVACGALAFIVEVVHLFAGTVIQTWRRIARDVIVLTVPACIAWIA